ncbi:hypothetical protein G6F56_000862 [Rhizopus delemar]|uniref:FHA domain-containing protein n=1 Tax=Rhizopus stolonifer TaxID=4846 RepID=A0A367KU92_RHIST|nr:hypothetical protein G6F56_000862 [Rhizopus delemar]RCI05783.1 hypothetical protein CU098_013033 [Rhizopus stolonifer]
MSEPITGVAFQDNNASTLKLTKQKEKGPAVVTVLLKPHNSHFQTRTLELKDKSRIRIGRQTSSKTAPTAFNGYFDSKVLSRQHAEILYDKHRVYIKDVKSSNGTFVNSNRLSNEGEESVPCEIKSSDEIEFGIDIINDDGSEVMYHKVSCLVGESVIPINTDTLSNNLESTLQESKPNQMLETILLQLQAEVDKSKKFQDELRNIKESVNDLDKTFHQENKHGGLQHQLKEAEVTIRAFDEKWRHQKQAIDTAKNELHTLEKQVSNFNTWKSKLSHELDEEVKKSKGLEQRLKEKDNDIAVEASTKSMLFMFVSGIVVSVLLYCLYH